MQVGHVQMHFKIMTKCNDWKAVMMHEQYQKWYIYRNPVLLTQSLAKEG